MYNFAFDLSNETMTLDNLIAQLQRIREEHGDMCVVYGDSSVYENEPLNLQFVRNLKVVNFHARKNDSNIELLLLDKHYPVDPATVALVNSIFIGEGPNGVELSDVLKPLGSPSAEHELG